MSDDALKLETADRINNAVRHIAEDVARTCAAMRAPHVLMRAKVAWFRSRWVCWTGRYALNGGEFDHAIEGHFGHGRTPAAACAEFDRMWVEGG